MSRKSSPIVKHGRLPGLFEGVAVDLFCGGGGMSRAWEIATGRCVDEAINHDAAAIAMHTANHPGTRHWRESVWRLDPKIVSAGRPVEWLHGSPDCTHFSIARGGKPVKKAIRGLAWCCLRYLAGQRPVLFTLENVREFATWGPLLQKKAGRGRWLWEVAIPVIKATRKRANPGIEKIPGAKEKKIKKLVIEGPHADDGSARTWLAFLTGLGYAPEPLQIPDPRRAGETFRQWKRQIEELGYAVDFRVLDAADYGAPTHRRRLFLVAQRDGQPIVWPAPTHGEAPLLPYRQASECIDFSIPVPSIFGRKKALAYNTLQRLVRGLVKFVVNAGDPFIIQVNHGGGEFRGQTIQEPLPTLCGDHGFAIVAPYLYSRYGEGPGQFTRGQRVDFPIGTITPAGNVGGLIVPFLARCAHGEVSRNGGKRWGNGHHSACDPMPTLTGTTNGHGGYTRDIRQPLGTIVSKNFDLIVTPFMASAAHSGTTGRAKYHWQVTEPFRTITSSNDKFLVAPLVVQYNGAKTMNDVRGQSLAEPLRTIPTENRFALIAPLVAKYYGTGIVKPATEPLDTITHDDRFALTSAFVVKHYGGVTGHGCNRPIGAITARDHHSLGSAWMLANTSGNIGCEAASPLGTITTANRHFLQWGYVTHFRGTHGYGAGGSGLSLRSLVPTITAGGGHIYLTVASAVAHVGGAVRSIEDGPTGDPSIDDGFWRVAALMRQFLGDEAPLPIVRSHGEEFLIYDLGLRMFRPRELLAAQFSPELAADYVLTGTQEQQVAKIGNSVPPLLGAAVIRANMRPAAAQPRRVKSGEVAA